MIDFSVRSSRCFVTLSSLLAMLCVGCGATPIEPVRAKAAADSTAVASSRNWPQWRGPAGNSVSIETGLPVRWSESENIAFKTPLPEWGTSTPAIWNDALFVTSEADGKLLLLRLDALSGTLVWQRELGTGVANRKVEGGENRAAKFHDLHNLASPSPVADGECVIAHFGNGELASYTHGGEMNWTQNLQERFGKYTIWWGHANSPVLMDDLVISVCMQDNLIGTLEDGDEPAESYLVAHHKSGGTLIWETERMTQADAEQCDSYTTPVFYEEGGDPVMVVMGGNQLDAYDPHTGEQRWKIQGLTGGRTITGPTIADDLVYTTIGMRGPLHAISLEGSGTRPQDEAIRWSVEGNTPDTCCPVVYNGLVFSVTDNAIATCLDAASGEQRWRERLAGGNFKASPVAADGRIYFLAIDGTCSVVEAATEFKVVAENKLDDEFLASPAIANGRIYLRGKKSLYAIERPKGD